MFHVIDEVGTLKFALLVVVEVHYYPPFRVAVGRWFFPDFAYIALSFLPTV